MPELATSPPMWADAFSNWEADLFIPEALVHLLLEQLPEVVVEEGLGQRKVKKEEDLVFRLREHYQIPIPIPRRQRNCWVYWPRVDLQCQDIFYDDNFTSHLHMQVYLSTLHKYPFC